jgi:hypothetical protein
VYSSKITFLFSGVLLTKTSSFGSCGSSSLACGSSSLGPHDENAKIMLNPRMDTKKIFSY